jgi:MoaA/NifB/PqqE/SkfB family radical SAM enzyme
MKNRNRNRPTFANINLLGKCNANCFFCLGKDLPELEGENQLNTHYSEWKNFEQFLSLCKRNGVKKLFFTGQTADGLQYKHLLSATRHLQSRGFEVGLRTNGYLALKKMDSIREMTGEIGYTINSLDPIKNYQIMARYAIPNWDSIIKKTTNCRFSIVVNRFNKSEILRIIQNLSVYKNVKYIQLRRVSTDNRTELLKEDMEAYDEILFESSRIFGKVDEFCTSEAYLIHGKPCYFWQTTGTTVNSFNYFTNGVVSDEYFIVEGYQKHQGVRK